MAEDLLSLKWNNHKPAFFHLLKTLREKGRHTDVTLTCGSQFFPAHRLVLVACSQFFSEVLEHTGCGRPVIVLKDVCAGEMEALLDYMYLGEVDVPQASLPGLIRAAESLKIKGLAVPDTDPNVTTAATATAASTTTTTATTGNGSSGGITTAEDGNQEPLPPPPPPPPTTTTTTTTTDDLHTPETQGRPTKRRKIADVSHSDLDLTSELQVQITEVKTEAVELSETTFDPSDLEMVPGQGQLQHFLSEEEGHAFEVMAGMSGVHGEGHDGSANESTTLFPSSHLIGPQIQEDSQLAYEKEDEEEERRRRPREEAEEDKAAVMVVEGNVTIPQNYMTRQMTHDFPKESDTPQVTPTSSTDIYQAMSSGRNADIPPNAAIGKCLPQNQYSWGLKYGLNLDRGSVDTPHSVAGGRSSNSRVLNTAGNSTNPENFTETRGSARESGSNGCAPGNQTSGTGYACPFCERLDMYESKYLRHLRVHTGEKPYICPVCDFRANTKHSVQRHIRMKHNNNKT